MQAYIAGPLFNDAEKAFNLKVDALVQSLGIQTYLPQRDGGELIRMIREGQPPERVRRRLFELDVSQVRACDLFIWILDAEFQTRVHVSNLVWLISSGRMYRVSNR